MTTCCNNPEIEILVNVSVGETRAAQMEDGILQDVHIQRDSLRSIVGNIYLGRVQRVLAGMQAAFVDIGLSRAAFLQISDMMPHTSDDGNVITGIQHRISAGDTLLVQVVKEAMGSKGARLSTDLALPSRFLVYMPYTPRIGISARIEDETERARLTECIEAMRRELDISGGFVVRTLGEGMAPAALAADMRFLATIWRRILSEAQNAPAETLLYGDLPLSTRMLRDLLKPNVSAVYIDDPIAWQEMLAFTGRFAPEFSDRVRHYTSDKPLFDRYGVEDAINRALLPKVPLKSGGCLIIEQTEAMVTVDVNTGGFIGTRSLEETVLRTNIEAARTVARQLRLRNLGGIIVIDFIDMLADEHKTEVLEVLAQALASDPARTRVGAMSPLGLVEITRKRTRESLQHILCEPCEECGGRGHIKTCETVCFDLFREMLRMARTCNIEELLVLASPDVVDVLIDEMAADFEQLCTTLACTVRLQAEALYTQEYFDLVIL
ncbi:MAG TPA: Rne/Rng family ribonuclease [Salinisphaeraceae bacterium]|nr:Rne/Rng family ribonuclease [Salinisphaeraceae bacterium]